MGIIIYPRVDFFNLLPAALVYVNKSGVEQAGDISSSILVLRSFPQSDMYDQLREP